MRCHNSRSELSLPFCSSYLHLALTSLLIFKGLLTLLIRLSTPMWALKEINGTRSGFISVESIPMKSALCLSLALCPLLLKLHPDTWYAKLST